MKNLLMLIVALFGTLSIFAQAPKALNYQGVARNLSGDPIPNQNIGLRMAILRGSATGTEEYKEIQTTSTNGLGLFNIQNGQCWRYTPDNSGQLIPTAIACPD